MLRAIAAGAAALAGVVLLGACGVITSTGRSVFFLLDASGSYGKEIPSIAKTAKLVIAELQPNDWLAASQISSCSFADTEVLPSRRLSSTPSVAAAGKRAAFKSFDDYAAAEHKTSFTDIKGALAGAAVTLRGNKDRHRFIIVYSDLVEDVAPDCNTKDLKLDLNGMTVIASHVTRTKADGQHPERYEARIESWRQIVTEAGGRFEFATSPDELIALVKP